MNRQCISLITNKPEHAAYQKFVACSSATTAVMPNLMSYEQAVVLPTCFSTAGMALFQKEYLGLEMPAFSSTSKNQVVFIWGGSGGGAFSFPLLSSSAIRLLKHLCSWQQRHSACKSRRIQCRCHGKCEKFYVLQRVRCRSRIRSQQDRRRG